MPAKAYAKDELLAGLKIRKIGLACEAVADGLRAEQAK